MGEGDGEEEKKGVSVDMWDKNSPDPLERERGICMSKDCHVRKYFLKLRECDNRVRAKPYTAETCHEETMDLIMAVDHCVGHKAFEDLR